MTQPKITNDDKMTGLRLDKIVYEKMAMGLLHKYTFQFIKPGTTEGIDVVYRLDDYLDHVNFDFVRQIVTLAFEIERDGKFTYFYVFGEAILSFTSPRSNITFQPSQAQDDMEFWMNNHKTYRDGVMNYDDWKK
jgi:hypothetical protein